MFSLKLILKCCQNKISRKLYLNNHLTFLYRQRFLTWIKNFHFHFNKFRIMYSRLILVGLILALYNLCLVKADCPKPYSNCHLGKEGFINVHIVPHTHVNIPLFNELQNIEINSVEQTVFKLKKG